MLYDLALIGKKPNPDDLFNVSSLQNFPQSKPSYASMYNSKLLIQEK